MDRGHGLQRMTCDRGDLRRRASGLGKHGDGGAAEIVKVQLGDAGLL